MGEEPKDKMEPPGQPLPLDYAKPERDLEPGLKVFSAIGGAVLSLIVVGIIGAVAFPYPIDYASRGMPHPKPAWGYVITFLSLAPLALIAALLLRLRRWWLYSDWFLLGLLIGVGVAGLLEGTCYANP